MCNYCVNEYKNIIKKYFLSYPWFLSSKSQITGTGNVIILLNIVVDKMSKNHWSTLNKLLCSHFYNCFSTHTHTCSLSLAGPQLWQLSRWSLRVNHCTNHSWDVFHLTGESSLWMRRQETSQANKSFKTCLCTFKTSCWLYKHTLCN